MEPELKNSPDVPVVMSISGTDPTGGAGIEADIEAIISMGCHATAVVSAVTVQDTVNVRSVSPMEPDLVKDQALAVLEDMPVEVIKIGLLGSPDIVEAVRGILTRYPDIPVVLDPVLAAGGGASMTDTQTQNALMRHLVPLTTVLTPNGPEARRLAPEADTLDACAMALLDKGCEFVLITGGHEHTEEIRNTLYGNHRRLETFSWERLPGEYHGSGCTLASAIAGLLAQGHEPLSAVYAAQEYTWQSLRHGYRVGMGQRLPNRLFWAADLDEE